jgi:hypothetical protein
VDSSITVLATCRPWRTWPLQNSISPGYFAALGVPILEGRDFTLRDTEEVKLVGGDEYSPRVAIVNEKFARKYFGNQSALGRRVGFGSDPGTPTDMEIVGVVKDIKYMNLRDEVPIQMFIPFLAVRYVGDMTVYVRSSLPAESVVAQARERVQRLDPNLPLYNVRAIGSASSDSLLVEAAHRRPLHRVRRAGHRLACVWPSTACSLTTWPGAAGRSGADGAGSAGL